MRKWWAGPDGLEVECKILGEREVITVSRWYPSGRYWIADVYSVDELRQHVDLADLVEVVKLRQR